MKKVRSILSTCSLCFAIAVLVITVLPFIVIFMRTLDMSSEIAVDYFSDVKCILGSFFSDLVSLFKFDSGNMLLSVSRIVLVVMLLAGIVFFVLSTVIYAKKYPRSYKLSIPTFILGLIATLICVSLVFTGWRSVVELVTDEFTDHMIKDNEYQQLHKVVIILCDITSVVFFGAMLSHYLYAVNYDLASLAAGDSIREVVINEEFEPTASNKGKPTITYLRRLIIEDNKVIRVLDEHYHDVTFNLYVAPGYVPEFAVEETEKMHYQNVFDHNKEAKIVGLESKKEVHKTTKVPKSKEVVVEKKVAPKKEKAKKEVKKVEKVKKAPVKRVIPAAKTEKTEFERISFSKRLLKADPSLIATYNQLKGEFLAYGLNSRVSFACDAFRLHAKTYVKITVAGKSLKLYFALDPKAYKDSKIPFGDASKQKLHAETPFMFKVKSQLSIRRAAELMAACAKKDKLRKGKVVKADYAKELKK